MIYNAPALRWTDALSMHILIWFQYDLGRSATRPKFDSILGFEPMTSRS